MSKVYICDVCTNIKQSFELNELTRKYRVNDFFGVKEKQEILHVCGDCWDRIKKEQRGKEADRC